MQHHIGLVKAEATSGIPQKNGRHAQDYIRMQF